MDFSSYLRLVDDILDDPQPAPPYDKETYLNYTRLNRSRMKRWNQQSLPAGPLSDWIDAVREPQHWIILTEPWCGDAAHCLPFLMKLAERQPLIRYDLELRDSAPHRIEQYLTNGSRSIPKLIVRDAAGKDLFTWGPRPRPAQELIDQLKRVGTPPDTVVLALQNWYNQDRGHTLLAELAELMRTVPVAK